MSPLPGARQAAISRVLVARAIGLAGSFSRCPAGDGTTLANRGASDWHCERNRDQAGHVDQVANTTELQKVDQSSD